MMRNLYERLSNLILCERLKNSLSQKEKIGVYLFFYWANVMCLQLCIEFSSWAAQSSILIAAYNYLYNLREKLFRKVLCCLQFF